MGRPQRDRAHYSAAPYLSSVEALSPPIPERHRPIKNHGACPSSKSQLNSFRSNLPLPASPASLLSSEPLRSCSARLLPVVSPVLSCPHPALFPPHLSRSSRAHPSKWLVAMSSILPGTSQFLPITLFCHRLSYQSRSLANSGANILSQRG